MSYLPEAHGDWGHMRGSDTIVVATEMLTMADDTKLFLRSWKTNSADVLLLLHGLGAHSGWFIDMGNELATRGLNVYAPDHRGFGRSDGLKGHIKNYHTYIQDTVTVIHEVRKRHPMARIYLLGHSMGAIFTAHVAAQHGDLLAGALFLNPWIQDSSQLPVTTTLQILIGGLFKSRRSWQVAGGYEVMTTNPDAIQMLAADTLWQRTQTSSFLVQILQMRIAVLKQAPRITIPALVMQAENDKSVLAAASRKFYDALASSDKTWKSYPGYDHDSELEHDRTLLDNDLAQWIHVHTDSASSNLVAEN